MTPAEEPEFDRPRRPWTFWRLLATMILYGLGALLLAGVAAGIVAFVVYDHVTQTGTDGPEVEVVVPQKATGRDVGRLLVENGLIEHEAFLRLAVQIDGTNQAIRTGAYRLHRGNSALQLLRQLYKGPSRQVLETQFRVTIPEGLTLRQVAELVKDPQGFVEAAHDPALIKRLGIEADSLEGFLMPNTYFFDAEPAPRALVERMLAQFEKEYRKLVSEVPGAERLGKLRIVTIASLVEEETKVDEERPLVARVIYNRIDRKMPLQLDSTLQFVLNKYGQRLLNEDKEVDSPYNTYIKSGLPPAPFPAPAWRACARRCVRQTQSTSISCPTPTGARTPSATPRRSTSRRWPGSAARLSRSARRSKRSAGRNSRPSPPRLPVVPR